MDFFIDFNQFRVNIADKLSTIPENDQNNVIENIKCIFDVADEMDGENDGLVTDKGLYDQMQVKVDDLIKIQKAKAENLNLHKLDFGVNNSQDEKLTYTLFKDKYTTRHVYINNTKYEYNIYKGSDGKFYTNSVEVMCLGQDNYDLKIKDNEYVYVSDSEEGASLRCQIELCKLFETAGKDPIKLSEKPKSYVYKGVKIQVRTIRHRVDSETDITNAQFYQYYATTNWGVAYISTQKDEIERQIDEDLKKHSEE